MYKVALIQQNAKNYNSNIMLINIRQTYAANIHTIYSNRAVTKLQTAWQYALYIHSSTKTSTMQLHAGSYNYKMHGLL